MKLKSILVITFFSTVSVFAQANEKAVNSPECGAVVKACEAGGFSVGSHKKNHKGLWVDCIAKLAKGKPVEGVSGVSSDEAKKCVEVKKQKRAEKK